MHIAINEDTAPCHKIINILPQALRRGMYNINLAEAEEIHLIQGKPMSIKYPDGEYYITAKGVLSRDIANGLCVHKKHIDETLERITKSSLYSVKDEIKNGYITIDGGHRIGICGTAVSGDNGVEFIKDISAMNIRIASEMIGISDPVIDHILNGGINSTLIISPPGCGKTTLLRDIIRSLSHKGLSVAVADERCEIAAMHNGESAFDLGAHTTVLENCPKQYAMTTLLRSMSPDIIATDELGSHGDAVAVEQIINSGVGILATTHGKDEAQLMRRAEFEKLLPMFSVIITLSKTNGAGTIERIVDRC